MQDRQRIHLIPKLFGAVTTFWFSQLVEFSIARPVSTIIDHCNSSVLIMRLGSGKQTI